VAEKKTIAVVGATGAQGGGLVNAILNRKSGPFDVRALTRDPESGKARDLASRGAEVFPVNLDDSLSVNRAFDGMYGAYCVTFFWEHMSPEKETAQGRTMAEAAKHAGIEHAIWSTFEDTRQWVPLDDDRMPTLQGNYKVPHFDAKADANSAFTDLGVPTTFLLTSYYWENLLRPGMGPRRDANGTLVLTMPMGDEKLAGISSEDIGKCAYGIFGRRDEYVGKTVGIAAEHLTGTQMAAALSEALGEEVRYDAVSPDAYRGLGFPGADEMGNMFQFYRDFAADFCGARDPAVAHCLNSEIQTFEQWLARNKTRIPRG